MTKDEYRKLLKHPKWQQKRLKIFERDGWRCQKCRAKNKELHIHHLKYTTKKPWKEKDENLITWCVDCHKKRK